MDLLTLLFLASTIVELFAFSSGGYKDCIRRNVAKDQVCELESSQDYQPCRCDADCELYRDCCPSTHDDCLGSSRAGEENLPRFHCQTVVIRERESPAARLPAIDEQYWMVSSCSSGWMEENRMTIDVLSIQSRCRSTNISSNLPPVTDQASGIVYRNEHCALCNGVNTFVAWDYSFKCFPQLRVLLDDGNYTLTEDDFNRYCTIDTFTEPSLPDGLMTPARQCYPQIDTCLELDALLSLDRTNLWNSTYYNDIKNLCIQGHFQYHMILRGNGSIPYRNEYCALCNGIDQLSIDCFLGPPDRNPSIGVGLGVPLTIILDVFGSGRTVETSLETTSIHVLCSSTSEVYDPVAKQCRSTVIQDCNDIDNGDNCTECMGNLISLNDSTSYIFTDASNNMLLYNEEQYTVEFNTSNGDPVICVNFSTNGTDIVNIINFLGVSYPEAYVILTYIGCPLSVIGCVLILLTYTLFKELRTLPSLVLMQLAIAILVTNLIILLSGPVIEGIEGAGVLCTPVAILSHYIFLSQFVWMSLVSTEISRKLHTAFMMKMKESETHKTKLFIIYFLVGWCTPLVIVLITVIVNFTTPDLVLYGVLEDGTQGLCWINHLASNLVSFVTPIAISLIYNTVVFIVVTIFLCISARSQSKVSKNSNAPLLRLNVAVFFVSGITWLFGFLAILPRLEWAWIPYVILNSIQGFVICIAFLGTKRVVLLYMSLCRCRKREACSTAVTSTKSTLESFKDTNMSEEKLV